MAHARRSPSRPPRFVPLVLFPLLGVGARRGRRRSLRQPGHLPLPRRLHHRAGAGAVAAAPPRSRCASCRLGRHQARRLVGGFMVATAFISMWVSNTATVVMMLPMALSLVALVARRAPRTTRRPATSRRADARRRLCGEHRRHRDADRHAAERAARGIPDRESTASRSASASGCCSACPLILVSLPLGWLFLTRVMYPLGRRSSRAGAS